MIIWNSSFLKWAFVVFWYEPIPKWKFWQGYKPGIIGSTLYLGPLKIVVGLK